jgi:hypothetical protein
MKYIFGIAILVAAIMAGWKMFEPEFTNILFQDDLRDTAAQLGWHTGLDAAKLRPRSSQNRYPQSCQPRYQACARGQVKVWHNGEGDVRSGTSRSTTRRR